MAYVADILCFPYRAQTIEDLAVLLIGQLPIDRRSSDDGECLKSVALDFNFLDIDLFDLLRNIFQCLPLHSVYSVSFVLFSSAQTCDYSEYLSHISTAGMVFLENLLSALAADDCAANTMNTINIIFSS
jgi:hypothetical protein